MNATTIAIAAAAAAAAAAVGDRDGSSMARYATAYVRAPNGGYLRDSASISGPNARRFHRHVQPCTCITSPLSVLLRLHHRRTNSIATRHGFCPAGEDRTYAPPPPSSPKATPTRRIVSPGGPTGPPPPRGLDRTSAERSDAPDLLLSPRYHRNAVTAAVLLTWYYQVHSSTTQISNLIVMWQALCT